MKAELLLRERRRLRADAFADARIWRVPEPVRGSGHPFKYSIAFVVQGRCILRYDNEAGKSDHKHMGTLELPYRFVSPERLLADFWRDVAVLEAS